MKFHPQLVAEVREFAEKRLASLGRSIGLACTESYLFKDDHWCGMRFTQGIFRAEWQIGSMEISFFNDSQMIHQAQFVPFQDQERRAA